MKTTLCRGYVSVGIPVTALLFATACYTAEARAPQSSGSERESGQRQGGEFQSDQSPQSGDRSSGMDQSARSGRDSKQRSSSSRTRWAEITGDIERVKKVSIRGGGEDHLAILVNTDYGKRVIADLGPAKNLRDVELRSGDWIAARGPVVRVNGRRVLLAKQLFAEGRTVPINRQGGTSAQGSAHSAARGQQGGQSITGQIQDLKELKVKGANKTHQVVRLKTQDGKEIVADLGAKRDLRDLSIKPGQQLSLQGQAMRVSGKRFILADQVSTDGRTVQLDRKVLSAIPASRDGQSSSRREMQTVSGEVIVKGEVLKLDRDGFYIVQEPNGQQVHLLVAQDMNKGFNVGDQIQAQVRSDGSVTSISKTSGQSGGAQRQGGQESRQAQQGQTGQ